MIEVVNLKRKLATIDEHWVPKVAAELNGQYVKLVKFEGPYVWHHHAEEDEMFLVLAGELRMELRDGTVTLGPGEFCVVPRGVEHRPVAEEEVECLLFEPASTRNTGNVDHGYTIEPGDLDRV